MNGADEATILTTVVAAVGLGMLAQAMADRFKVPAILPLLLLGIGAGSSAYGLGWVAPASLGHTLEVFIHLGVAIILFEGGLSLDLGQLARVGGSVGRLLSLGVLVTGVGAAALARWLTDIPWSTAALFGAIVTVTGPTVVAPLLRHMIAPRGVKTVLMSEGLIVDPIGAVLAYLVLQWIERASVPVQELVGDLLILFVTGSILGFAAGAAAQWLIRRRLVSGELRNLVVLAILMLAYLGAESQAHQSGILTSVVMGITLAGADVPDLVPLKTFKGQLTILFISVLFILLAAQLELEAVAALGASGLLVAAGLILLVRPLAVLASVWNDALGIKERVVLSMTAPRGIVAAAVASLAARQLDREGIAGGAVLEGLVYLVILVTGIWATASAVALPRLLGYRRDPSRSLTVLVGANPLARRVVQLLAGHGRSAAVVDSSRRKLEPLRAEGAETVCGDARNAATYEDVGVERDTVVLALTPNDELNLVVADLLHEEFGIEHPVVVLQQPSEEFGKRRRAWIDLFGGRGMNLPQWLRRLDNDQARFLSLEMEDEDIRQRLRRLSRELEAEMVLVCGWKGAEPSFARVVDSLDQFDTVTVLARSGEAVERLEELAARVTAGREKEAAAEEEAEGKE